MPPVLFRDCVVWTDYEFYFKNNIVIYGKVTCCVANMLFLK